MGRKQVGCSRPDPEQTSDRPGWVQIPALPSPSCVAGGSHMAPLGLCFSLCKMFDTIYPLAWLGGCNRIIYMDKLAQKRRSINVC